MVSRGRNDRPSADYLPIGGLLVSRLLGNFAIVFKKNYLSVKKPMVDVSLI